jgi:endonuclease YncB( thermonuclease family)
MFVPALIVLVAGMALAGVVSFGWQGLTARLGEAPAPLAANAPAEAPGRVSRALVRVVDGDTIDLDGHRVRLVGFNAPETWTPACAAEAKAGNRAKARLRDLVASEPLSYRRVACSCVPGAEGTQACNYGRACGSLFAGGRDVGDILVSERLAVPYRCGRTGCPPVPRPWCG